MVFKQSKQKQNKIKIKIFTTMLLMQYFCLQGILPLCKSYPEIESIWPTTKWKARKSFEMWYYIVTRVSLCVSFSSKSKAINVFPKHILKSKARDQSIQATKKLFCHVIVQNYSPNVAFWSKLKARGGAKSKNRDPSSLYLTVLGLSEAATGGKSILKNLAISTGNTCVGVYF